MMSNFSFTHRTFYPLDEPFAIFSKFKIAVLLVFEFGKVENLSFGNGLKNNSAVKRNLSET